MSEFTKGVEHGRKNGLCEAKEIVQKWLDAYPLDIFSPNSRELKESIDTQSKYDAVITKASAHMGRHMATRILEQLHEALYK